MGENCPLNVEKSNIKNEKLNLYMSLNSASDMYIRERLTRGRPCPHQRQLLNENYAHSSKIIENS